MGNSRIGLQIDAIDNTRSGLSSAFNNVTKMTTDLSKKLVLEVNVAFPDIASKVKNLTSELSKAKRAMGSIDFVGTRYGKSGKELGILGFDGKTLRKDMSLDSVKGYISQLQTILSKLNNNTLVSAKVGKDFDKEKSKIQNALKSLTAYKDTLDLIFRTNSKFNTQLTSNASRLNSQAQAAKRSAQEQLQILRQIDRERNRINRGGNSNATLASMRSYYRQQEQSARRAAQEVKRLENSLVKQGTLLGRLKGLATRYFSIYTVINFGRKIAEVTGYFEQQKVALEGIIGSASEAKSLLNEITNFALKSPFQAKELVQFTKQLSAFGVRDNLFGKVKELADISTGLGVDMNRIILAYGQVKSATVLRGQELRQFTEAGIPMVEALAKKFTELNGEVVRTADIFDMISKRQVSFDMVASVLSDMTKEGGQFYRMQDNITNTMYGQMQKLKDLWTIAMNDIGKSTFPILNNIIKLLQEMVKNSKVIVTSLSAAFLGKTIAQALVGWRLITDRAKAYLRLLKMSTKARSVAWGNAAGIAIGLVVGAIAKAVSEANKLKKAFEEVENSFSKENSKMISGLESLTKKISQANFGSKAYQDAISTLSQNYGDFVSNDIIQALKAQDQAALSTARAFGEIAENIKYAILHYNKYQELVEKKEIADDMLKNGTSFGNYKSHLYSSSRDDIRLRVRALLKNYYEDFYGQEAKNDDITSLHKELYNEAINRFVDSNNYSYDNFKEKIKEVYKEKIPEISDEDLNELGDIASGALQINEESRRAIKQLTKLQTNINKSVYSSIYRYFNEVDVLNNVKYDNSDEISNRNNVEAAYIEALYNTIYDQFKTLIPLVSRELSEAEIEGYRELATRMGSPTVAGENILLETMLASARAESLSNEELLEYAKKAREEYISNGGNEERYLKELDKQVALLELLAKTGSAFEVSHGKIVATESFDNSTIYEINNLIDNLRDTLDDSETQRWLNEVSEEFNKHTETKSNRAAIVSDLMENNLYYTIEIDNDAVKALWLQLIPSDLDYEDKRKSVQTQLDEKRSQLREYNTKTDKDEETIRTLELQIIALELLASADYFNISEREGGQKADITSILNDFITELKTAYTRYKEASQKGGGIAGIDYVKNDTAFNKEFGEFFHGVESELFNKLSDITVGGKSAFDILKDKFISGGLEDGILGFEDAVRAVADELIRYGELDKENRKAYINVGKALEKWADNTFSKDKLNSALKNLESELKSLTNTFKSTTQTVELYRKLQQNGTAKTVGLKLGGEGETNVETLARLNMESAKLDSQRQRENILSIIDAFNKNMPESKFELRAEDLVDIKNINKIIDNINQLSNMNNGAFSASPLGKNSEMVVRLLEDLIQTIAKEMSEISGEVYTGDKSSDMYSNAKNRYLNAIPSAVRTSANATDKGTVDYSSIKKIVEQVQTDASAMFEQFMSDNRLDLVAGKDGRIDNKELDSLEKKLEEISKDFPEALRDELMGKLKNLRQEVDKYNASIGAYTNFGKAIKGYKGAEKYAKQQYDGETKNYRSLLVQSKSGKSLSGETLSPEKLIEINTQLALSKERLEAMGVNGVKLKDELQKISLSNLKDSIDACSNQMQSMVNVVNDVVNAAKAFSKAINHVYDVMNDGENPEWMQDMDGFLNDFGETFEALAAPMIAVISLVSTLTIAITVCEDACTPLLIALAVVIGVAAVVAGIVAAVQQHDRKLQRTIEDLQNKMDECSNSIKNLNDEAERVVGLEKQKKSFEALSKACEEYIAAEAALSAEKAKSDSDEEELRKLEQQAIETKNEYLNQIKDLREGILFSVEDMASRISDALRSAFQNGTNAARDMAAAIKESIGDIVQNMITTRIIEPQIQKLMEDFMGGTEEALDRRFSNSDGTMNWEAFMDYLNDRANDPETLRNLENGAKEVSENALNYVNTMSSVLKDYFSFNGELSGMSGGISGITEDTARQLEGINNSMLMQLVILNQGVTLLCESPFANIQTSWFADVLAQVKATRANTDSIYKLLSTVADPGTRTIKVTVI